MKFKSILIILLTSTLLSGLFWGMLYVYNTKYAPEKLPERESITLNGVIEFYNNRSFQLKTTQGTFMIYLDSNAFLSAVAGTNDEFKSGYLNQTSFDIAGQLKAGDQVSVTGFPDGNDFIAERVILDN